MNAKLAKMLSRMMPDFEASRHVIYKKRPDHIVSGFCLESVRNTIRVSRFALPLYDLPDYLNLNYSRPLEWPNSVVDCGDFIGIAALAGELVSRFGPYMDEIDSLAKLEGFREYLSTAVALDENARPARRVDPYFRYGLACTLVLLNEVHDAIIQFEAVRNDFLLFVNSTFNVITFEASGRGGHSAAYSRTLTGERKAFLEDVNTMIHAVRNKPSIAVDRLLARERTNRETLLIK